MARAGVGVGMLEVARVERAMERRPSFAKRVFSDEERSRGKRAVRPAQRYAAYLAARAAVLRALDAGPDDGVGRRDISVSWDTAGRPVAVLSGRAAELASGRGVREVALSLSLTHEVAVANAVAMTEATRPQVEERTNAKESLLASFRQVRSVLDELELVEEGKGEGDATASSDEAKVATGQVPADAGDTRE